ncbi:hypothetical protein ACT7C5_19310 [Bacillus pacificus]
MDGKIKLKDRYVYNANWQSLEKTYSSLAEKSIDSIQIENKLIILSTEKDLKDIRTMFPATVLEKIIDYPQNVCITAPYFNKNIRSLFEKISKTYSYEITSKYELHTWCI